MIVGTTTLPEYGILPTSARRASSAPRATPGTSNARRAAPPAARPRRSPPGCVPVAHGNDGGGSIRIPAACCGLVGLKPSRGRISAAPELGDSSLVIDGMLTRTVADTAAILDVLAGYEPGDATWAPPPPEPFATSAGRAPGPLRIAATTRPPVGDAAVDPIVRAGRGRRGRHCCARSVTRSRRSIRRGRTRACASCSGRSSPTQIALSIAYSGNVAGREPTAEDMEPMSWAIFSMVKKMGAIDALAATVRLQRHARQLVAFLERYDALLTPALAERPLPLGTLDTAAPDPMATFTRSGLFTPFTPVFNATGQPGISLPLFEGEDGLPLGVQLVGRPAGEGALLALAAQLEEAAPWAQRRPQIALGVAD